MAKMNPVPEGMHSITPHRICAGMADAIAFYNKAFGAEEIIRLQGPQGGLIHACLRSATSPSCWPTNAPIGGHLARRSSKDPLSPFISMSRMLMPSLFAPSKRGRSSPSRSRKCSGATVTASWKNRSAITGRSLPACATCVPLNCKRRRRIRPNAAERRLSFTSTTT